MTEHPTFHPAFALTARSGLGKAAALSWSSTVQRAVRLLVPVDLQALVVKPGEPTDHADIAVRLLERGAASQQPRAPKPFTDAAARKAGAYLHWALPDGLTETTAPGSDGQVRWRALPNRWMVARLLYGLPHPMRYWIIESDRGRSSKLSGWAEEAVATTGLTPKMQPSELTAVVGGDPAWAAVYDSVESRFAFHDDWSDLQEPPGSPTTYVVVGWYSQPELDPLDDPKEGFHALMQSLGWTVDVERLAAARKTMSQSAGANALVGLVSRIATLKNKVDFAAVADKTAGVAEIEQPWWPTQSVYHGVVYGVRVKEPGDPRIYPSDPRPETSAVQVSVGVTSTEALAKLVATRLGDNDAERLQTIFGYGLTDALGRPEGIPRIEEELHARAFESKPGGEKIEKVRAGDPFEDIRPAQQPTPESDRTLASFDKKTMRFDFIGSGRRVADLHLLTSKPDRVAAPPDPRRIAHTKRPLPRWMWPQDPVVMLQGLKRSLRHGYDRRFTPDERLACRLSGDTVTKLMGVVDGRVLIERGPEHGGLPDDAEALVIEAAVEDPFTDISEQIFGRLDLGQYVSWSAFAATMRAEARLFLWTYSRPGQATELQSLSLKDGVGSSPAGITIWRQPWVPLYLEWELEADTGEDLSDWELDELDYEPRNNLAIDGSRSTTLSGRSLLVSAGARALADQISAFLDAEDKLDLAGQGQIDEAVEAQLGSLSKEAGMVDVLSAGFEGLRTRLLGFTDETARAAAGAPLQDPPPTEPLQALRAGLARMRKLRVVDSFGRTLPLVDNSGPAPAISEGLRSEGRVDSSDGTFLLRPRLNQPARLMLRMVDARDDAAEATIDQSIEDAASPLAGWLLPDHADGAIELFSTNGDPLGQLLHDGLTDAVVWEGPPGDRGPVGAPPVFGGDGRLRHVGAMVRAILERDSAIRATDAVSPDDTPLRGLMRVIDTTAATIAPGGTTGAEHVAQLVGRPVAVVRATLLLEVEQEWAWPTLSTADQQARSAAWAALAARQFRVRLGALTRLDDALLGYFLDDDYSRLYPVHESVVTDARDSGPHQGDLNADRATEAGTKPIDTPYVSGEATVLVRPGQLVRLTLLVDPSGKMHVTSGVLPRKAISLLRDWIAEPLERVVPSFRIGPVLVDPATIRMPLVTALGRDQQWSHRDAPAEWRHDPIVAASQQALLPETAAVVQEGYMRVLVDKETD